MISEYSQSLEVIKGRDYLKTASWILYLKEYRLRSIERLYLCMKKPEQGPTHFAAQIVTGHQRQKIVMTVWNLQQSVRVQHTESDSDLLTVIQVEVRLSQLPRWLLMQRPRIRWSIQVTAENLQQDCWNPIPMPLSLGKSIGCNSLDVVYFLHLGCDYALDLEVNMLALFYDASWYAAGQIMALTIFWMALADDPASNVLNHNGYRIHGHVDWQQFWKKVSLIVGISSLLDVAGIRKWLLCLGLWIPETGDVLSRICMLVFVAVFSAGLFELSFIVWLHVWIRLGAQIRPIISMAPSQQSGFQWMHNHRRVIQLGCLAAVGCFLHPALVCLLSMEHALIRMSSPDLNNRQEIQKHLMKRAALLMNGCCLLLPSCCAWLHTSFHRKQLMPIDYFISFCILLGILDIKIPSKTMRLNRYSRLKTAAVYFSGCMILIGYVPAAAASSERQTLDALSPIFMRDHEVYTEMSEGDVDVAFLWDRLRPMLHHLDLYERRLVGSALIIAHWAHEGQFRKSGEPFVTHPVEVARILGGLRLDADTIVAGLLHDTVEDTDRISFDCIASRFGPCVRRTVMGVTRLTKTKTVEPEESIEDVDFCHFFQCLAEDVRISFVKLADRLHNLRTMDSLRPSKRKSKALETLEVYVPLAGLLGLNSIKEEMEDLSLYYLDPDGSSELKAFLEELADSQSEALTTARVDLEERLKGDPVLKQSIKGVRILPRQPSIYGLYDAYRENPKAFKDHQRQKRVAQLRVVLETEASGKEAATMCYYVMGAIHLMWNPIPGEMKDCIATPRPSAFRGLETSVRPSTGGRLAVMELEILIQTSTMWTAPYVWPHSNMGPILNGSVSANTDISVKQLNGHSNGYDKSKTLSIRSEKTEKTELGEPRWNEFGQAQMWVESLQRLQTEIGERMSHRDYVDCIRNDFLSPSVYVFTPAGECIQLPKGATVLDFAYHINTAIGNRTVAARVNGNYVDHSYELKNAQVVEILTTDWVKSKQNLDILRSRMGSFKTTSARRKLRLFLEQFDAESKKGVDQSKNGVWSAAGLGSRFWLRIYCDDTPGVLADVARVIADHGLNIKEYSGGGDVHRQFVMNYQVHDLGGSSAPAITSKLEAVEGCTGVVVGCALPDASLPHGWHYPNNGSGQ